MAPFAERDVIVGLLKQRHIAHVGHDVVHHCSGGPTCVAPAIGLQESRPVVSPVVGRHVEIINGLSPIE